MSHVVKVRRKHGEREWEVEGSPEEVAQAFKHLGLLGPDEGTQRRSRPTRTKGLETVTERSRPRIEGRPSLDQIEKQIRLQPHYENSQAGISNVFYGRRLAATGPDKNAFTDLNRQIRKVRERISANEHGQWLRSTLILEGVRTYVFRFRPGASPDGGAKHSLEEAWRETHVKRS